MIAHFTWNPVSYIPGDINAPILAWTKNDKLLVFKNAKTCINGDVEKSFSGFNRLVEKYNIKFWVYQEAVINEHPFDYDD